ncbi:MAG: ABC transporter ATP-binding protein [Flexilinea sp.]
MRNKSDDVILRMENIVKCYGDLVANDNVDLRLYRGEILAIIGENGAGKTTLMKVLYGLEQPDNGDIYLNEKKIRIRDTAHAIANGIGMVQQHFMLFDPFTVTENIVYGKEPKKGIFFDIKGANQMITDLSQKYDLPLNPAAKIKGMPVGLRQRVEILKVLYQNADIIIFDEPTAVLTPQEVHELLNTMKQLAAAGKSIIIVTHKLNEVMEVADRAMVMRSGKLIADVNIEDTSIEDLSFMMVGRHLVETTIPEITPGKDILYIKNLCLTGEGSVPILDHITIHNGSGEIVGIAGVSGNGQSELVQCLFGLRKADNGTILVNNRNVFNRTVNEVRNSGVAMIPEDRFIWGSASQATVCETAIMGHYKKPEFSRKGLLNVKNIWNFAVRIVKEFSVKVDTVNQKTSSLSGGNAQKLIVARELTQKTPLLLACEPTRGIDIGSINFIHDRLIEKRSEGAAILLISSELSEILKLSDRIYVIFDGKINGEFTRGNVSEEELGLLMVGGRKK